MNPNEEPVDREMIERLNVLRATPPRNPQKAALGRARYLTTIHRLARQPNSAAVVSAPLLLRLKEWLEQLSSPLFRKERLSMVSVLTTLLVVFSLVFGGAGATAYAAQGSLPNEVLYPVKTVLENTNLALAGTPEAKIDLLVSYADRRADEMLTLSGRGEAIPLEVAERYNAQVLNALELAAELDDAAMQAAVAVVGVHIRQHDRLMSLTRTKAPEGVEPVMSKVQAMLRLQIGLSELGMTDPTAFRYQLRLAREVSTEGSVVDGTEPTVPVTDTLPCETCTPQLQKGPGPGPGPANQGELTKPEDGYGPYTTTVTSTITGTVPGAGFGPGPLNQGEVTQPESGYGPGEPTQGGGTQPGPGPGPVATPSAEPSGQGGSGNKRP